MNPEQYTDDQKKDIEDRVSQAKKLLDDLQLQPAAQIYKVNLGDDMFGDKIMPYLQDTKYSGVLSPIQDV